MLTHLYIENFVLVEKLDLEFHTGMTVVTGETGAGKSIILEALILVLGARADSRYIRTGATRCEVVATFDIHAIPAVSAWLETHALSVDNFECLVRRQLTVEGRSRCFINAQPVPAQLLRELGALLLNMHGQHENQRLLQREAQRELLDSVGGHLVLVEEVARFYHEWQSIHTHWQNCQQQLGAREQRLAFLQYQRQEFPEIALNKKDIEQLEITQRELATAEQRLQQYQHSLSLLNDDNQGVIKYLRQAMQSLPVAEASLQELLENARIQIEEAIDELQNKMEKLEINPEKLEQIEQQFSKLHDLARKHRVKMTELPQVYQQLDAEWQQLQKLDHDLSQLENQLAVLTVKYQDKASELRQARQQAALQLTQKIENYFTQLGMTGGKLEIRIEPYEDQRFTAHGSERVEFLVSINPGQPLQPLAKVASGGELSRISLAIQAIAAQNQALPTLIFDEVDVGIGGATATIVGQLLKKLSVHAQVLCITHLPQVAAQGSHHLQVVKQVQAGQTVTQLQYLSPQQRVEEVARMLGGVKMTSQTLAHAEELLAER